jgi:lipopolysaccharide export LptBFGC system permease protein LptF
MTHLQIALSVLCLLVAVLLVVLIVRDRRPGRVTYAVLALLEVGLVAELVLGLVRVFGDHEGVSVAPYVGYLVGALVILPLAAGWAWAERTRSGTGVLLVGVLVLPVLFVRLHDLWATHV